MSQIAEIQTRGLAEMFSESKKEYSHEGFRIVIEELGGTWDYEIFEGKDYVKCDQDFESEVAAIKAAKKYIDNIDSDDRDYAQ